MFVDIFEAACEEHGIAPTRLLLELGIGKSALSNWRRGSEPSNRTKKQIADYFGVSVYELMEGKAGIKKEPAAPCDGFDEDLKKSIEVLSSFTPEYRKLVLKILEDVAAHEKAKE